MSFLYLLARTQLKYNTGISLAVQWLKLCTSIARGMGWIPGLGARIPHAWWYGQKTEEHSAGT